MGESGGLLIGFNAPMPLQLTGFFRGPSTGALVECSDIHQHLWLAPGLQSTPEASGLVGWATQVILGDNKLVRRGGAVHTFAGPREGRERSNIGAQ